MMSKTHNYSVRCAATASRVKMQRRRYFALLTGLLLAVCIVMPTVSGRVTAAETMTPLARVFGTPKGQLKSPYPDVEEVADEGYKIYKSLDCGGCHGGGGGGGMAAPLTNPVWIYGNDDDTLFRLIALGTGKLSLDGAFPNQGFVRKGSEAVVGPMPPYGEIIQSEDDLWKIIAWIRRTNSRRHR